MSTETLVSHSPLDRCRRFVGQSSVVESLGKAMDVRATFRRRRKTGGGLKGLSLAAGLLLQSLLARGDLQVSPHDSNWKSVVETAPDGSTVRFEAGVYTGCNVSLGPGQHMRDWPFPPFGDQKCLLQPGTRGMCSRECAFS